MDSDWNHNQCVKCDTTLMKCPEGSTRTTIELKPGKWRAATNHYLTSKSNIEGPGSIGPELYTSEVKGTEDWASVSTTNGPSFIRDCHPSFPEAAKEACPAGRGNFTGNLRCGEGHIGPLCALCDADPHDAVYDADGAELQRKSYGFRMMGNGTCAECVPSKKQTAYIGLGVVGFLGVTAFFVSRCFGKKIYEYLSVKNTNGESTW